MNQSSAQKIVEKLQSLGIQQDKITQDHLMLCYADLKKIKSVPDFKSAKAILVKMSDKIKYDSAEIVGVIVETRCHPALEKIVSIFTSHLNIPIQIFHGLNNRNYILNTEIKQLVDKGKVCLTELPTENLQAKTYNALFLSESFWSFMMGRRKVLVFQTDAICCPNSDYRLNEFLSFDYIGSLWPQERPVGLLMNGGVGGLSLRDWKKSVDCLKRFSPVLWPGGEDGYFSFHLEIIGAKVANREECAKFSTQYLFLERSFGAHQISCLSDMDKKSFLNYCPEAKVLLTNN